MLTYSYDKAKTRCLELRLPWNADFAAQSDVMFARLGLTQEQVDELSVYHCHLVKWMFSPRAYRWWQRIAMAVHFLFGRK